MKFFHLRNCDPLNSTPKQDIQFVFCFELDIFDLKYEIMGIFDLFKKKQKEDHEDREAIVQQQTSKPASRGSVDGIKVGTENTSERKTEAFSEGYEGDLGHTAIIKSLLDTSKENRDDEWVIRFLSHVATASFVSAAPQVIQGPDKFPYFQIFIPEPSVGFQCYVIEKMIDDFLLENGFGIALEPKGNDVEWVLTYGDLLHYSVHKTFAYPVNHGFVKSGSENEVLDVKEQVLVGSPSESILPTRARHVIKSFLQAQGVADPKVCLINRQEADKGQHLVFNIVPWQFKNEAHYQSILRALGWFLPGYYSFIGMKEELFKDDFLSL